MKTTLINRFSNHFFLQARDEATKKGYLGFWAVAMIGIFWANFLFPGTTGNLVYIAAAIVDLYLHISRQLKCRLPLSMPAGLAAALGFVTGTYFQNM